MRPILMIGGLAFLTIAAPVFGQYDFTEMGETTNAAALCMATNGVRLDDRRTSPEIIARAAKRACQIEASAFESAVRLTTYRYLGGGPADQIEAQIKSTIEKRYAEMEDLTIQAILEMRVKK